MPEPQAERTREAEATPTAKPRAAATASPAGGRRPDPGIQTTLLRRDLIRPEYPVLSRRRGEEGTVRVRVWILEEGSVGEIEVAGSSGYRRLDRAAFTAVRDATSRPEFIALSAGDASLPRDEEIEIEFRLEEEPR